MTLFLLVIIGGLASGCIEPPGKEIEVLSSTPESVEIWGRNQIPNAIGPQLSWATDQQIADLAQSHCHENGRDAHKVLQRTAGGARIVLFDCVVPLAGPVRSTSPGVSSIESNGPLSKPAPAVGAAPAPAPQPAATSVTEQGLSIVLFNAVRRDSGLQIQGLVINSSNQPQTVPTMQGSLEDHAGKEVRRWVFEPPVRQLAPGERANFKTEVRPVPTGVARATVAFLLAAP
jgi:hypothetical protein